MPQAPQSRALSAPPSQTPSGVGAEPATTSTVPGVIAPDASGRTLGLSDVFAQSDGWSEGRFDVSTTSGISGLSTDVSNCGETHAASLELRLAHRFKKLEMKVGQANTSKSADALLVVEIYANEKQIDSRTIPFDRVQSFTETIDDVNALKIFLYLKEDPAPPAQCNYDSAVAAVIAGLTVSG